MAYSISPFYSSTIISPDVPRDSTGMIQPFINFREFSKRNTRSVLCCYAAAKHQKSGSPPATKKKNKPRGKNSGRSSIEDDFVIEKGRVGDGWVEAVEFSSESSQSPYSALPLPKPTAGFVLDEQGRVLMASYRRIATIVDSANNFHLECIISRVFRNLRGDECMLLCPVDTPVQILKSVNVEGWSAVSDEEVESILPAAAYTLAKMHMHLVHSGFVILLEVAFATQRKTFDFHIGISLCAMFGLSSDNGEDVDGLPTEGIEIACFHLDGSHYMIYTPSDPLLFIAVRDKIGVLQIADNELLDDPAVISAIDEETEFNALVEEEDALLDSLLGVNSVIKLLTLGFRLPLCA